ncbi:PREDICTED: transforming growth factor-beta-induced protein ig-h3-like [Branchiostoma belcheri]|uniref:Transforming growth factor-beta-induced protein ig-h3-like n=1 Tax=Branchiostoma belcheri TaxID=7741 RepID=A0A6P5A6G1_BRABE|nr:PREDICTED: transforming growth factor-beta-induced protein ig-h3-like [Branchiostoma belcheri]
MKLVSVITVLWLACVANAQWPLSIIDVLEKIGNETTLISLTKQAGLYDKLSGLGPFTMFAPNDRAFELLPKDVMNKLQSNKTLLKEVLEAHIVTDKVPIVDWTNDMLIPTMGGQNIRINIYDVSPMAITLTANGAGVVNPDCHAIAGFVQTIDLVMYPLINGTIMTEITSNTNLSTLANAVSKAGLVPTLSASNGNFTIFAPTNAAFAKLPAGVLDGLLKNVTALKNVLTYHVLSDVYNRVGLYYSHTLRTMEGKNVTIKATSRESIMVNNAAVLTEISKINGVLQVIDTVLIPPTMHFELVHNKDK